MTLAPPLLHPQATRSSIPFNLPIIRDANESSPYDEGADPEIVVRLRRIILMTGFVALVRTTINAIVECHGNLKQRLIGILGPHRSSKFAVTLPSLHPQRRWRPLGRDHHHPAQQRSIHNCFQLASGDYHQDIRSKSCRRTAKTDPMSRHVHVIHAPVSVGSAHFLQRTALSDQRVVPTRRHPDDHHRHR